MRRCRRVARGTCIGERVHRKGDSPEVNERTCRGTCDRRKGLASKALFLLILLVPAASSNLEPLLDAALDHLLERAPRASKSGASMYESLETFATNLPLKFTMPIFQRTLMDLASSPASSTKYCLTRPGARSQPLAMEVAVVR